MTLKTPITGDAWTHTLRESVGFLHRHSGILFCAYPDADAVGSMLSLALYLQRLGKRAWLVRPGPLHGNVDFLEDILNHNRIAILDSPAAIRQAAPDVEAVVFCDTANHKLVPFFSELAELFINTRLPVLEIDHHFGTDSAPVAPEGLHLFRQANATAEITAELLEAFFTAYPDSPNPFEQRNIVVSLLTGLITDTGGGNIPIRPDDYEFWNRRLGGLLTRQTRGNGGKETAAPQFASAEDIRKFLVTLTAEQTRCVEALTRRIVHDGGVGYLNLLDSVLPSIEGPCRARDPVWFPHIRETVANVVPDIAGGVGLLFFVDQTTEGDACIYLKIRRSLECPFDLRECETAVQTAFGTSHHLGGGGHPGAVSFRIRPMPDAAFLNGINQLTGFLRSRIDPSSAP